jgi:hypothetical protein
MSNRDRVRLEIVEHSAEIKRLHDRVHETFKRRSESEALRSEWKEACAEFQARYNSLCVPGGWDDGFYERILSGDAESVEAALCILEIRPYFFGSGYLWKTILQKCKRAPMSEEQAARLAMLVQRYREWRLARNQSAKNGLITMQRLGPLLLRLNQTFSLRFREWKFDGIATVHDLYLILCESLKLTPLERFQEAKGTVRQPRNATPPLPQADDSVWISEYLAWRDFAWTSEDVWATLARAIVEVYELDASYEVSPKMPLPTLAETLV